MNKILVSLELGFLVFTAEWNSAATPMRFVKMHRRCSGDPWQLSRAAWAHRHTPLSFNVSRKSKSISNPFCLYLPWPENGEKRETRSFSVHRVGLYRVPLIREAEGYKDGQAQPFSPQDLRPGQASGHSPVSLLYQKSCSVGHREMTPSRKAKRK